MEANTKNEMVKDDWMSEFYGKPWFIIKDNIFSEFPYGMIEWKIDASDHEKILKAHDQGFILVESAVEFQTIICKPKRQLPDFLRLAKKEDFEEITKLIEICYFNHTKFFNRFKIKRYFSDEQANNYYLESFKSAFYENNSFTIIASDKLGVFGFYTMRKLSNGKYKGILTGVHPRMKGKKLHILMQNKCYDIIGHDYTVINRTQLGNYQIINNHIKEKRHLEKVELIFYLDNF
jgi:hypothetical protein